MRYDPSPLDHAYDRLGRTGFDEPGGYVNHGPMVCEALDALGRSDLVDSWSRDPGTEPTRPSEPRWDDWRDALGVPERTSEWMGHFGARIDTEGWRQTVSVWLPRLVPALGFALFHGAIRTAHAVRAISRADTPARRDELARSLGYWAGGFTERYPSDPATVRRDDLGDLVVEMAADAALRYRTSPNILNLHCITAAMSLDLMLPHLDDGAARTAVAQLGVEQAAINGGCARFEVATSPDLDDKTLVAAAIASGEGHAVKLVEACRRGTEASDDPAFAVAAERVVRRGLRALDRERSVADGWSELTPGRPQGALG